MDPGPEIGGSHAGDESAYWCRGCRPHPRRAWGCLVERRDGQRKRRVGGHLTERWQRATRCYRACPRVGARELPLPAQQARWQSPTISPIASLSRSLGSRPRLLLESHRPFGLGREWETTGGGLSTDGSLICLRHSENGDILHFGLRILTAHRGQEVADLVDPGLTVKVAVLVAGAWRPTRRDHSRARWDRTAGYLERAVGRT